MIKTEDIHEILNRVSVPEAIGGTYSAVKFMNHTLPLFHGGFILALDDAFQDASPQEKQLAGELIRQIEKQEKMAIVLLTQEKIREYVSALSIILSELIAKERPYDEARGKRLLAQLRAA